MPGWTSALKAQEEGEAFARFYEASNGQLPDHVVLSYAEQLSHSTTAARNIFLEVVAKRIPDKFERAQMIARLNDVGSRATTPIQVRIRRDLLGEIDARAADADITRSEIVRDFVEIGVRRFKILPGGSPNFHYRWTDDADEPPVSWERIEGSAQEIRWKRDKLIASRNERPPAKEALFMGVQMVTLWTVVGPDRVTDETRWDRVRPDEILDYATVPPGITVWCA